MTLRCFGRGFISLAAQGLLTNWMLPETFGEQTVSVYLITFKVKLKSCPNHVSSDLIKMHHTYCTALVIITKLIQDRRWVFSFLSFKSLQPVENLKKQSQKKTSRVWFLLEWSTRWYAFSPSSAFLFPIGMHVKREGFFFSCLAKYLSQIF